MRPGLGDAGGQVPRGVPLGGDDRGGLAQSGAGGGACEAGEEGGLLGLQATFVVAVEDDGAVVLNLTGLEAGGVVQRGLGGAATQQARG